MNIRKKYLVRIKAFSDNKYREFQHRLSPGIDVEKILGIRIPILRKFATEISKEEGIEYIDEILKFKEEAYYEEMFLCWFVLGKGNVDNNTRIMYFRRLSEAAYDWSLCDSGCGSLKFIKKNREEFLPVIKEILASENPFAVRTGVVALMQFYCDDDYVDMVLEIFKNIRSSEYYINMAVGWAISIWYFKYKEKIIRLFEEKIFSKEIQNIAVRKIIESSRTDKEEKNYIRNYKIEIEKKGKV